MTGIKYDTSFFRAEIERLSLLLTQPVTRELRASLQNQLTSAKEHLADLQNPISVFDPADNGNQGS